MNALETLRDDRFYTQQLCSLSRPIARASGSILLPRNHYKRHSFRLILHRGVVDTDAFAVRLMNGHTALNTGHHQVFDPYIRERATQHHLVIAAARTVAIEVFDAYTFGLEIQAGRRIRFDCPSRTDVVCCNRVAKDCEWSRIRNIPPVFNRITKVFKVGRFLNVG